MTIVDGAAVVLSALGIVTGVLVSLATGSIRSAVPPTLELWTAAGLVRLGSDASWNVIATAALILFIRRLVVRGLHVPRGRAEQNA